MFIVYSGSFTNEDNAINEAIKLFKSGYDVVGTKLDSNFRLQVGEFSIKENAIMFTEKLKADGFNSFIEEVI